ncbi:MAG: ATP-binding protein, partial [Bacteroidetes bacterium]|nr:ATP-binding protein [Bacteroidota bacterium]
LSSVSETEARQRGAELSSMFERTMSAPEADSAHLNLLIRSARLVDDLNYLVLTDSSGAIRASINILGARMAGYNFPEDAPAPDHSVVNFRTAHPVTWPSLGTGGKLYLGFERQAVESGLRRDRQYFLTIGSVLFVIALFLIGSMKRFHFVEVSMSRLRQARRELALEKGTLESEITKHREKEASLKQSEQRYRSLLESTMQAAFKDLERQKANLEKEVEEKTQTQEKLRRTTRRLRALNSIERKIVDEESLSSIVDHAVSELEGLLGANRVSVVQLDEDLGTVSFMSARGMEVSYAEVGTPIPMEKFRPFKKGLFVARNLARMPELAPLEEQALVLGLVCYCRVTLTAGDQLAGALNVAYAEPDLFDEEALKVVRDVADLLSIAFRQHAHHRERQQYQDELIAERDRAEEMARLKTAFLTNMTHEIRTPLSGIIGFAQVLDEELEDERKEFARLIQDAAKRLMSTINSVLDLSRLQADKEAFHLQQIDVSSVVAETVKLLEPLAERKDIGLERELGVGVTARLDRHALEAIVNNLVGNAIKFTESGAVRIEVHQSEDEVELVVSDTGIGISESFLPHLFDEFRQEYMDADRLAEGSGLGLAITSRIVEKLGGCIEVASTIGQGSTFTVHLPRSQSSDRPDRDATPAGQRPSGKRFRSKAVGS